MTVFEILNFNRELLQRLQLLGLKTNDCQYIDLYNDFSRMQKDGEKVTYIVSYLANKYGVSERMIYKIAKRFGKHCTDCSAV